MRGLKFGDDAARGLGVPVERVWLSLIITGFSSPTSPPSPPASSPQQIARPLAGLSDLSLLPAALVGATIMLLTDLAGDVLFAPPDSQSGSSPPSSSFTSSGCWPARPHGRGG